MTNFAREAYNKRTTQYDHTNKKYQKTKNKRLVLLFWPGVYKPSLLLARIHPIDRHNMLALLLGRLELLVGVAQLARVDEVRARVTVRPQKLGAKTLGQLIDFGLLLDQLAAHEYARVPQS